MQQTRYPIYILSKGRPDTLFTARTLHEIGQDFKIVIEPQEHQAYINGMKSFGINPDKILVLPFSNLGLGSIPVRNWIWEHALSLGHKRAWTMDCNMRYLYRIHKNTKLRVRSTVPLLVAEDYTDRFTNVAISGLQYHYFVPTFIEKAPVYYNTRIYSCILLDLTVKERWRVLEWDGKPAPYNEDTDLSLQLLENGYCSLLLNSFTIGKMATHSMKGGNSQEVYKLGDASSFDNRYAFAASLQKAHPECVEITQKWGRWHHSVNYDYFKKNNKLILKPGMSWPEEYHTKLKLVKLDNPNDMTSTYTEADIDNVRMNLE